MKYTLGSSSLDNHLLMIGCFIMLTNFSVYAYLLTLTLKSYGGKGVRETFHPLTLSPWGRLNVEMITQRGIHSSWHQYRCEHHGQLQRYKFAIV